MAESFLVAVFRGRTARRTFSCLFVSPVAMARPLLKIQRYFRRKPIRFFSFILLYLTAGSLVFLHSGFSGDLGSGGGHGPLASVEGGTAISAEGLGIVGKASKDMRTTRRFGLTWMKARNSKEPEESRGTVSLSYHPYTNTSTRLWISLPIHQCHLFCLCPLQWLYHWPKRYWSIVYLVLANLYFFNRF